MTIDHRQPPLTELVADLLANPDMEDPTPIYRRLLAEAPVHRGPQDMWIVSSQEHLRTVVRSKEFLRSGTPRYPGQPQSGPAHELSRFKLVHLDEPEHTKLRALLNKAFTPRAIESMRSHAESVVKRRLAELAPQGEMDVLADFSHPFTLEMICWMLGLPVEDGPMLLGWTADIIAAFNALATPEDYPRADAAAVQMSEYFRDAADRRRADPGDDIFSNLVREQSVGERLSSDEFTSLCIELGTAAHETTANTIANALLTLLRHPEQLELLRSNRSLFERCIEECLRFASPVRIAAPYRAAVDVALGPTTIRSGDRVQVWLAAANRDPAVFEAPDVFDITREDNRHVAFTTGIHFCLGRALARLETEAALHGLIGLPGIGLDGQPLRWRKSFGLRALQAFPVRWDGVPTA